MCEAEEGLIGFEPNRLVNASRLTSPEFPLGHHWSWECPMQKGCRSGVTATEDRIARLG